MTNEASPNPYEPTSLAGDRRYRLPPLVGCLFAVGLAVAMATTALFFFRIRQQKLIEIEVRKAKQAETQARESARQAIEKTQNE